MKKFLLTIIGILISFNSLSQITTPAGENFDNGVFPPTNWAVFDNGVSGSTNVNWAENQIFVNSTPASAFMQQQNLDATTANPKISQDYLATPSLTLPTNAQIKFVTTNSSNNIFLGMRYQVRIKLASAGPQNNPSGYNIVREWNDVTDPLITSPFGTFEQKVITNIPAQYIGVPVYIAFCVQNTQPTAALASQRWFIDDIKIEQQCFSPALSSLLAVPLSNQATLSWAAVPGAIGYEIENILSSGTFTNTSSTNPNLITGTSYLLTGLTPVTSYTFQVRAVCGPGNFGPWVPQFEYQTSVLPPACGGIFTDSGGATGNYINNNPPVPIIITPDIPTNQVTVTFTSFNTELGSDILKIYDGNTQTATNLIGTYSGTTNPGTFTASTANGSLSFVFISDGSNVFSGWAANVTCAPPPPCAKPTILVASAVTPTTATINWTQIANPNGTTATDFEYILAPFPSTVPLLTATGTTTSTKPLLLTNLAQGTCFDVYLRAVCSATEKSIWSKAVKFCTLIAPPECGGIFLDDGGLTGNYSNSFNNTATPYKICPNPANPLDKVTVTFTAFSTEANYDGLLVYNGNSITAPIIPSGNPVGDGGLPANSYWGTTIPGPFESTSPDGCLTFVFRSDSGINRAGWRADVTCAPVPTCVKPKNLVLSLATTSSIRVAWTNVSTGTNEVLALPCGSPTPTAASTGFTSATSNPFVISGLTSGTCYDVYVRTLCSATDISAWSIKQSGYTLVLPEICGGNFVDQGGLGIGNSFNYPDNSNRTSIICPTAGTNQRITVTFSEFDTEVNWDGLFVYDGNTANPLNLLPSGNPAGNGGLAAGAYWGTTIPGPFTSESADGCMTFVFKSDRDKNEKGWLANITCSPIPLCKKPRNLVTTPTNLATQMNLTWTQQANLDGSFANAWQVIALPCGAPTPTSASAWINTSVRPYKFSGLLPNTCYDFYVQAVCSSTQISDISTPIKTTTPISCGQNFYDNGGLAADYTNNADNTTTICPTTLGEIVTVAFTQFDTDASDDGLYVYDGISITAPQISSGNPAGNVPGALAGAFWGQTNPLPFVASNPTGCLTFRFRSNGFLNLQGWEANVTCAPAPTCARPFSITALPTSSAALIGWVQPPNYGTTNVATAWEVLVQLATEPAPTASSTGIPTTNNPFTAINLNPDSAYNVYIRAVCSNTDSSAWSIPFRFDTYPINDECSGAIAVIPNQDLNYNPLTSAIVKVKGSSVSTNPNACLTTTNGDVWFKFVANSDLQVLSIANESLNPLVTLDAGDVEKLNFAVYSGTCTGLTQVFCGANQATIDDAGIIRNLTVGQTYYIRAFGTATTDNNLIYRMVLGKIPCAESLVFCPDPITGIPLINYANKTGGKRRGFSDVGCLNTAANAAFFKLVVNQSGRLNYEISQTYTSSNLRPDVDYVTWGPFVTEEAACLAVASLSTTIPDGTCPALDGCSFLLDETEFLCIPNAIACQIYIIMITNYNDQPGFIKFKQLDSQLPGSSQTACSAPVDFEYSKKEYCKNEVVDPIAILNSGSVSGVYSIVPSITNFDVLSGQIDLATTPAGTYVVKSNLAVPLPSGSCPLPFNVETSRTVIITNPANASINYATTSFCNDSAVVTLPTFTGTTGGLYKSTPAGLAIDAISGAITPVSSTPAIYNVTYKVDAIGGCPAFETPPIQITILGIPVIVAPNTQNACGNSYTLPALVGGNTYHTLSGGLGTTLAAGTILTPTAPQTIYVYESNGICDNEKQFTITLKPTVTPIVNDFGYFNDFGQRIFCKNASNPIPFTPNPALTSGGVFSATPTGLIINSTTGVIDLFGSIPASYSVRYEIIANPANCILGLISNPVSVTIYPIIVPVTDFQYSSAVFCKNEANPTAIPLNPAFTVGGTYGSTAGLVINPTTGLIDLTSSLIGNYVVKYKIVKNTNTCVEGSESTFNITIKPVITVTNTLAYGTSGNTSLNVCNNNANLLPIRMSTTFTNGSATGVNQTATITGTYSATPAGLVFVDITTGVINTTTSAPNTYSIIFTSDTVNTDCRAAFVSAPFSLTITGNVQSVANFTYSKIVYCANEINPSPEPLANRTTGGIYSSATGLVIDALTGEINLSASIAGTYRVFYTVASTRITSCVIGDEKYFDVTINANIVSVTDFTYNQLVYYKNQVNPSPIPNNLLLFTTGGSYGSNASGIVLDTTTGLINLTASTVGIYTITYSIAQNLTPCLLANSNQFTLEIKDTFPAVTTLSYSSTVYCANEANPSPVVANPARTLGGIYSATPTGLSINANTGEINLSASSSGTYNVVYTVLSDIATGLIGGITNPPVSVKINAVVVPTFTDIEVCQNLALVLPTTSNNVGNNISGTWSPAITSASTNISGDFTYTFLPDSGQCASSTSTIKVKVKALPIYGITGACQNGNYTLEIVPQLTNATYEWFKTGTTIALNSSDSKLIVSDLGGYFSTVTVNGCSADVQFNVTNVVCEIQKGISPNNDGMNDEFDLSRLDVKLLEIFNRYGTKVYSKSDYKKEWFGQTDAGDTLPDGTYFYVITLVNGDTKTDWVYINK